VMTLRFVGAIVAGAMCLAGCVGSGDTGELVTSASVGRDNPGATGDTPPSTRDEPTSACIACDVNYDCSGSMFAAQSGGQFQLSTSAGTCVKALIDLVCSGALFSATGCTGGGGGPFTCGGTTCSPSGTRGNIVGVTTTTTPTLPPTTTTTSPPSGGSMSSQGFPADAG
jgi:hypothetical protein